MYGNPYYKPYWQTEDPEDSLEHYGVKGMKWGVRKDPVKAYNRAGRKFERLSYVTTKRSRRYNKTRSTADYLLAKRAAAKQRKFYDKMEKTFSNIKFSDLEKSQLNRKYIALGNDYENLESLFRGELPSHYVIPDMRDVGSAPEVKKKHG